MTNARNRALRFSLRISTRRSDKKLSLVPLSTTSPNGVRLIDFVPFVLHFCRIKKNFSFKATQFLFFEDSYAISVAYWRSEKDGQECHLRELRQMPVQGHQYYPRGFQRQGRARSYLWSHCRPVQPPLDNFAQRREADRFRRGAKHSSP